MNRLPEIQFIIELLDRFLSEADITNISGDHCLDHVLFVDVIDVGKVPSIRFANNLS